jgi:RNA polymerase sigma-70 factor (ECF subfamily)
MLNAMELKNDPTIIKEWVELYSDTMYSWAYHKTSSKETAEDLVQETFMAVIQSINKFEGKSNPKTWLFSILNNKINDYYRSSFRKPMVNDSNIIERVFDTDGQWKTEERPHLWAEETEHLLDNNEFQDTLGSCMKKLPDNWYAAIHLKYHEDKDSRIICQELQITPTNFWQILHRAKLQLRKCLELYWFKK